MGSAGRVTFRVKGKQGNVLPARGKKPYGGVEVEIHAFLTLDLDGETTSVTRWIGVWLRPKAGLDILENRKMSGQCPESNHDSYQPDSSLVFHCAKNQKCI